MTPYDALIIGAGHNGLVTAAYLARAGLRVLALERRPVVGGSCVTEEVWPGYRVSTAAYLCGLLQPRIINDLDLGYFGYEILPKDPAFFSPFPDGRRLFIWRDDHQTAEEIARFSQTDARRYAEYEAFLARLASFVEPWLLTTPPDVLRRTWRDLWQLGRLGLHTVRLPPRTLAQALRLLTQSARDFLDAWFDSPELKAALATDGVIGARGGPSTPGTAYVLFYHRMGGAAGEGRDHGGGGRRRSESRRGGPHRRGGGGGPGPRRQGARRGARGRRGDPRRRGHLERRSEAHVLAARAGAAPGSGVPARGGGHPHGRRRDEGEPGSRRPAGLPRGPGHGAGPTAPRHHSCRAVHGLHRPRVGRRPRGAAVARAVPRGHHPDDV